MSTKTSQDNSDWVIDEWILLLDFYIRKLTAKEIADKYRNVFIILGTILQHRMDDRYRNHDGLNWRISMFKRMEENALQRKPTKRAKLVYDLFLNNPVALRHACDVIYSGIYPFIDNFNNSRTFDLNYKSIHREGFYVTYLHNLRNKPIVTNQIVDKFNCKCKLCNEVSTFESHYNKEQINLMKPKKEFNINDYVIYCPGCHNEIHKSEPWINLSNCQILI